MNHKTVAIALTLLCTLLVGALPYDRSGTNYLDAIRYQDLGWVKRLISEGIPVDQRDAKGRTPLWRAAGSGQEEIFRCLVDAGADIHATNLWGGTVIGWAAAQGQKEMVQHLIDLGAKVDAADRNHETPLHHAVSNHREDTALLLLKHGASPGVRAEWDGLHAPIHIAATLAEGELVSALLEAGARADSRGVNNITALHLAASHGRPDSVERLIVAGADVNALNGRGDTPLHFSVTSVVASTNKAKVVSILLENGADPCITNLSGRTPLEEARENGLGDDVIAAFSTDRSRRKKHEEQDASALFVPLFLSGLLVPVLATTAFFGFRKLRKRKLS